MDINQVVKQLEWMDEERRRDKNTLLALQDKVNSYTDVLEGTNQRLKSIDEEMKRLSLQVGRMNQFDGALVQQRVEIRRMMDDTEKKIARNKEESDKALRVDMKTMDTQIAELFNKLEIIQELRREVQTEGNERLKVEHAVNSVELKMDDFSHMIEDYGRIHRQVEEGRRQDAKQVDGLQGEVIALRKRIDERRSELEALGVNLNRVENRLNEILALEGGRRAEQQEFIEQQNGIQVERDKSMRDWVKRLEIFEKQGEEVQLQIQSLDVTHKLVKRGQEVVEMISDRLERRINEITELQRLTEERFRQDWSTFKGDDQKRWADYTLSQDERFNEILRQYDKMNNRLVELEDQFHITRDVLGQLNMQTEKGLQVIMEISHSWLETYQQIKGSD